MSTSEPKKRGRSRLVGCIWLIIGLCVVGGIIYFVGQAGQLLGLLPTDTPIPTRTATLIPSNTPVQSDTPIPPTSTNTPIPTHTPPPIPTNTFIPTSTSALTAEEQIYAGKVADLSMKYADAMEDLSNLSYDAGNNPLLLLDDNWKLNVALALTSLTVNSDGLANIEPVPERFKGVDNYLGQIQTETASLTDNYTKGVDNLDVDLIQAAVVNINNINALVEEATEELIKIAGEVPQ